MLSYVPMKKKGLKSRLKPFKKILKSKRFLLVFLSFIAFCFTIYLSLIKDLPSPTRLTTQNASRSTQIFDRNQNLLYSVYADKNQAFIPLQSISKYVKDATIAIEDKNFYKHGAIDLRGI